MKGKGGGGIDMEGCMDEMKVCGYNQGVWMKGGIGVRMKGGMGVWMKGGWMDKRWVGGWIKGGWVDG